jgi:hypothetical protein
LAKLQEDGKECKHLTISSLKELFGRDFLEKINPKVSQKKS